MNAIRVLRSHGMPESALQQVFRAVVVSKLTYAAPAWWGFTTSTDRQRIDGIFRRANKSGLWTSDSPTFEALCSSADDELFTKTSTYTNHILHSFCHHCQPPLNPTALDGAHTHINSLDIQPTFWTATSSPECCTKTPIRHYLSFYCSVCACTC